MIFCHVLLDQAPQHLPLQPGIAGLEDGRAGTELHPLEAVRPHPRLCVAPIGRRIGSGGVVRRSAIHEPILVAAAVLLWGGRRPAVEGPELVVAITTRDSAAGTGNGCPVPVEIADHQGFVFVFVFVLVLLLLPLPPCRVQHRLVGVQLVDEVSADDGQLARRRHDLTTTAAVAGCVKGAGALPPVDGPAEAEVFPDG